VNTTTSTLIGETTTQLVSPDYAAARDSGNNRGADVLLCARLVARLGIANATAFATAWAGTGQCGAAAYVDADTGARLASISGACPTSGVLGLTGLSAFTFAQHATYRHCVCATVQTTDYLSIYGSPALTNLLNAFTPTVGVAAEPCVNGVLPVETGAIAPFAGRVEQPELLIE
jgi:hypothetical protein